MDLVVSMNFDTTSCCKVHVRESRVLDVSIAPVIAVEEINWCEYSMNNSLNSSDIYGLVINNYDVINIVFYIDFSSFRLCW